MFKKIRIGRMPTRIEEEIAEPFRPANAYEFCEAKPFFLLKDNPLGREYCAFFCTQKIMFEGVSYVCFARRVDNDLIEAGALNVQTTEVCQENNGIGVYASPNVTIDMLTKKNRRYQNLNRVLPRK